MNRCSKFVFDTTLATTLPMAAGSKFFYNQVLFHSPLGCKSPVDFETQLN